MTQLIKFLIAMPVCNINILLGFYSKKSFIRMWDMVPILKGEYNNPKSHNLNETLPGIGWSVAIYQIFMELFNSSAAGLALIFIPHFFKRDIAWKDCKYEGASDSCHPMFPKQNYTMKCCSNRLPDCNTYVSFSTLDYLRYLL